MKKVIVFTLTAALMSGCGIYKKYERPAELKTDGIYGDAQSGTDKGIGDIQWRQFFSDPTLQALIEKGLSQNTDIRNADLRIQEAQYALQCAKLAYIPSVYFSPSGTVSKMYDPYKRDSYTEMTSGNSKTYALPVSMSWQIGSLGYLRNNKRKADVSLLQLKNAKQAVQASLVANIASMYYQLSMLDEQLELTKQTRDNWEKYLTMQRQLMQAGQSNMAAVSSIEATYYSICTSVESLESNIRIVENTLATLLGETASHVGRGALSSFRAPSVIETGAPISILSRRPDVKAAELTLASAFYDKNIAKSAFYPSLTISASGQYTNSLGNAVVNPGMMIGTAIASLTQPIFSNGRLRAQYKVSKAEMEIAVNDFQQTVIAAGNEVNTAMVNLRDAETQKELYGKQVESLTRALDATKQLFATSSVNYLNVINAQNSLLQAQMSLISNQMESISSTISLYQALGGGAE